jgi:hypothetical protein
MIVVVSPNVSISEVQHQKISLILFTGMSCYFSIICKMQLLPSITLWLHGVPLVQQLVLKQMVQIMLEKCCPALGIVFRTELWLGVPWWQRHFSLQEDERRKRRRAHHGRLAGSACEVACSYFSEGVAMACVVGSGRRGVGAAMACIIGCGSLSEGAAMACRVGCERLGGGAAMTCEDRCSRRGGGAASDEKSEGWRPVRARSSASMTFMAHDHRWREKSSPVHGPCRAPATCRSWLWAGRRWSRGGRALTAGCRSRIASWPGRRWSRIASWPGRRGRGSHGRAMQGTDEQGPARCWAPPLDGGEAHGSPLVVELAGADRGIASWRGSLRRRWLRGEHWSPDALIAGIAETCWSRGSVAGRRWSRRSGVRLRDYS